MVCACCQLWLVNTYEPQLMVSCHLLFHMMTQPVNSEDLRRRFLGANIYIKRYCCPYVRFMDVSGYQLERVLLVRHNLSCHVRRSHYHSHTHADPLFVPPFADTQR